MPTCAAVSHNNRCGDKNSSISFHKFPKDEKIIKKEWSAKLGMGEASTKITKAWKP